MTFEELLLAQLQTLEWTEEVRPAHPWRGDILVRKSEVEQIIRGEEVTTAVSS